mmetsp:Transcript_15471/g.27372  ORF Transcript_15471/g.27372 Transcript_15471/m.27372 type:complete len:129 (-) Transcript_15471:1510-1896(-)
MADDEGWVNRAEVPQEFGKELVACFGCRLIKAKGQFVENGCENCEHFMGMRQDWDRVLTYTTTEFSGIMSVIDPPSSWVCKWKHLSKAIPGCYAVGIQGRMDPDLQDLLENNGITWHKVVDGAGGGRN